MMLAPQIAFNSRLLTYSNGVRGVAQTVGLMRELVRQGRIDPAILAAARSLVFLTPEKDAGAELQVIFDHVQNCIRYTSDIHEVETLSSAAQTLAGRCGDCDDKSVLLASLFEAVGYPTRFVVAGYEEGGQLEHVYVQVCCDGEWIDADATEPHPLGWAAPDAVTLYVERV